MTHFRVVVGLGNPGSRYERTRHNIGFLVVSAFAEHIEGKRSEWRKDKDTLIAECSIAGEKIVLLQPQSFMNLSGEPVARVSRYLKVEPQEIIAVHDEIDLPLGAVRIKRGGGDGGHRGVRSLTENLGSPEFARLRVGIGRPAALVEASPTAEGARDVKDWVLQRFSETEEVEVQRITARSLSALEVLIVEGLTPAQNRYNELKEGVK